MDVVNLKEFYSTSLGQIVMVALRKAIVRLWPENTGDTIAMLGYSLPYSKQVVGHPSDIISFMPASLGAIYWPADGQNRTVLVSEKSLPLPAESLNRVLAVHMLEYSRSPRRALQEIWRVLVPGGRAIIAVPNRRSLWSSSDTPFGEGHPYSIQQIAHQLGKKGFTLVQYHTALFIPPVKKRWVHRVARYVEWIGRLLMPESGGVILIEVEKQIYASIPEPVSWSETIVPAVARPAMSRESG